MPHKVRVYPHNDLLDLANYHRNIINEKVKAHDDDALSLDCLSFIVAIAFGIEAFINFIGSQAILGWKERQPFRAKIDQIYNALGGTFNENIGPYQTIWTVKQLRDSIAHGQPIEKEVEVRSTGELWVEMSAPWDHCLDESFVNQAYSQVKAWQDELLNLAKIPIENTITKAEFVPRT